MLYPQNGDRIVTTDSVTSLHPVYKFLAESWQVFKAAAAVVIRQVRHGRPHIGANQWRIQDFCKGGAAAGAFGVPQAPSCPLSLRPLRKFRGS